MEQDTGRLFIENTKYKNLDPSPQRMGIPPPPPEKEAGRGRKVLALPDPGSLRFRSVGLAEAVNARQSFREYLDIPLTLEELSYLLWCTQGVKSRLPGHATFRTVPSAGARHAFDTLILVNRVNGLKPGLYRYFAMDHTLGEENPDPELTGRMVRACLGQEMVRGCAVLFIWVAVINRMVWRYGQRGYRYILLDAGHICQNLYLVAEDIDAGACALGAFDDDEVNALLGLDGTEQFALYMASLGKRSRSG